MKDLLVKAVSRTGAARLWRMVSTRTMPVIFFHGVLPEEEARPFNSSGKFTSPEKLTDYLGRIMSVFEVVPFDDLVERGIRGRGLRNAMAITFDDGYANNYTYALPVLEALGAPFTVFVTTGLTDTDRVTWNDRLEFAVHTTRAHSLSTDFMEEDLGLVTMAERRAAVSRLKDVLKAKPIETIEGCVDDVFDSLGADPADARFEHVRYLTSRQIREMAGRGVTFGAHTVTHPILSREKPERVRQEITASKAALEALTGREVTCFAYPNGRREDYNDAVIEEVKRAGFRGGATSVYGLARPGDDPYQIKRIVFDGRWPYEVFETRISGILTALRT
jgi:peptidoglycan/xylan/chitin deacetylase (PgdA/CDA1 family)